MEIEKIITINSSIETATQRTLYIVLTNKGNMFKSYDLEIWDIVTKPKFDDNTLKLTRTHLNG